MTQATNSIPMNNDNKCERCTSSICCTYFTHLIDTPRKKTDFDFLLWQISHKKVEVFKEDGKWFLLINNSCAHLLANGMCAIYDQRPLICKEHDNNYCEFDASAESGWQLHFKDYQELLVYCKKRFKKWNK